MHYKLLWDGDLNHYRLVHAESAFSSMFTVDTDIPPLTDKATAEQIMTAVNLYHERNQ